MELVLGAVFDKSAAATLSPHAICFTTSGADLQWKISLVSDVPFCRVASTVLRQWTCARAPTLGSLERRLGTKCLAAGLPACRTVPSWSAMSQRSIQWAPCC